MFPAWFLNGGKLGSTPVFPIRKQKNAAPMIIGCSTNAMEEDKRSYLDAGMKDFLAKPFPLNDLRAVMIK